ncbi:MAG TPA: hypothetical protein VL981_09390 [Candidatus Methylacidiphilales bacterium]|nr:hypothetical protein [Candidatus Methylacidiphilales bacterium]
MSTPRQFWTLLKFHVSVNPFIGFMLIAFGVQPIMAIFDSSTYHSDLSFSLFVQNIFFVLLLGLWILAPDMAQQSWGRTLSWSSGTEFLLTRAISRSLIYRTRAVLLYALVLLIPVLSLVQALKQPDLKVTEFQKPARQMCLATIAGSVLESEPGTGSSLIFLPWGKVLVGKWQAWLFIISALATQILLMLVYPLKRRTFIFYALFFILIFGHVWIAFLDVHNNVVPPVEHLFFVFASHQMLFWGLTVIAVVIGQLWCERRFAALEHQ